MDNLEIENDIMLEQNLDENIYLSQKNFLETDIGKTINTAIDIGLKAALPNLIEDEIINIKNSILEQGFSEGIKSAISSALDMGKSLTGIVTGNFENISQIQMAIKKGGILDKISGLLDFSINLANKKNLITNTVSDVLKKGKNSIIDSISDKIEESLADQMKSIEKIEKYCQSWNNAYENRDFSSMEKAYRNINKNLEKTVPLQNIINNARKIENLHNLIKNNGKNFEITEDEIKLAETLN